MRTIIIIIIKILTNIIEYIIINDVNNKVPVSFIQSKIQNIFSTGVSTKVLVL